MRFLPLAGSVLLQSLAAFANCESDGDDKTSQIQSKLGPLLSSGASLDFPSSPTWDALNVRASTPRIAPQYAAIVEVATEKDVQNTIKIANELELPFLAVSGTHGWPTSLAKVYNGIQINMRKLNQTEVSSDGTTATVGGGTMQYEITASLFEENKQAVTGLCECVSAIGPLMGGGHSMLQGRHGYAADNLVSARVVLADGTAVTASASENNDLFWAIRGAGHNFGVVTSFELSVYDVASTWTMTSFSFTQDKLEAFFDTWNQLEVDHPDPGMLVLNGLINRNADLDTNYPVVSVQILYEGTDTAADDYTTAFRNLGAAAEDTVSDISYGNLYTAGGFGLDSPVCRKDQNIFGFPNSYTQWDGAAMRRGFEIFTELTSDEVFSTSAWLAESYGRGKVQQIPESDNAVAPEERRRHLLTSPMLWWQGNDESNKQKAADYGERIQKAIRPDGFDPHTYVNYAPGGEQLGELYGREAERLGRLKKLKQTWDPENRFGFYNPLV